MITLAEWKIIGITLIATFFISAIVYGIMCEIVAKMKNKIQKSRKRHTCHKELKITLKINSNDFVNKNFKATFLFENKNREQELLRLFN